MPIDPEVLERLLVKPGEAARLSERDAAWGGDQVFAGMKKRETKATAKALLKGLVEELALAQELLWANGSRALLVVLQALDAAGKDGTIEHVMSGVNPQGCEVRTFKQPSNEELSHDFLWRATTALPERGRIGIFNRSHYEEVLAVRVHPEWLTRQKVLPPGEKPQKSFWKQRFEDINDYERHLERDGTTIVKFFLHVSKAEQRKRFIARLTDPGKEWKFSADDVQERRHWDEYMDAYEDALTATSTSWAPWYVVPADHKYLMRTLVAGALVHVINGLDLHYPEVTDEQRALNEAALRQLQSEG